MSHLTTSAHTKTDAGAPGPTGTSPGQNVGSDQVQDQSNTHQDHKKSNGHKHPEEKHTKSDSMDPVDVPSTIKSSFNTNDEAPESGETNPGVSASTKTESGAPGITGTSPGQAYGADETRDKSPKVHDHHKHRDNRHSEKQSEFSEETKSSESAKEGKSSKSSGETDPGVTANSKIAGGASGPTGTSPGEVIGSDETRDESPKHHDHHKHHHHQGGNQTTENKSSASETDPGVTASTTTKVGAPGPTGTSPGEGIGSDESRDDSPKHHDHNKHSESHNSEVPSSTYSSSKPKDTSSSTTTTSKKSEDGFDGPNASFTSEIGSRDDPGRVAEEQMYEKNAQTGDVGSMGPKLGSTTDGGQFAALNREETA